MADPSELLDLTPAEQRVLGSLLEKEVTVPGSYPMTAAGLRTACNQSSSREPVTDYDERVLLETVKSLKDRDLVAVTWADSGRRTLKYLQRLTTSWDLDAIHPGTRALLTVLLLRGAQPPGALRTRTERLHPFADRGEVEQALTAMAACEPPLVRQLPRRAREQDARWVHLLGEVDTGDQAPGAGQAPAGPAGDDGVREQVLAEGPDARDVRVRTSYDSISDAYADTFVEELDDLPLERWLLDQVVDLADGSPVVEVGCGPGHVTAYLAARGADASGVDLSPRMVKEARRRFPDGRYDVGDLRRLMRPPAADGWGAVLAWYSLIHLAPSELAEAVASLARPMTRHGRLLLALHAGRTTRTSDTWLDRPVDLTLVHHELDEVVEAVRAAGLVDVEWYRRGPYEWREETSERLYVLARHP